MRSPPARPFAPHWRVLVASFLGAMMALAVLWLLLPGGEGFRAARTEAASSARPNIILVLTDDLDHNLGTLEQLPKLRRLLAGQGTTFTNMFVSQSMCCPSRASIQRGQYVHNHQVLSNSPPEGGFERFHELGHEGSTIGTWLQAAGYRTGLLGKYLNGYPNTAGQTYMPPGWDEWASPVAGLPYSHFNYTLNENGTLISYGNQPEEYLTDVLARKAASFVEQAATDRRPFFLYVGTYAPHFPAPAAPRHAAAFPWAWAPRLPSYNEAEVSDKPAWVQAHPLLRQSQKADMDVLYRRRLQSMLAVQDLVERLIITLLATGQIDNTYLFFTSDNGYHLGEHRLLPGKLTPYEEDIRVPLLVRGPGVPAGSVLAEIVGNVDLAPTFAALAGATVPAFVDGRSLAPLLLGISAEREWRAAFLIEQEKVYPAGADNPIKVPDAVFFEPLDPFDSAMAATPQPSGGGLPSYTALRTKTLSYVVYSTGELELYDLAADPYQLANVASTADPALIARLNSWLDAYRRCSGAGCRVVDVAPPR